MTNRVGHAQGGVMVGMAVGCASATLPHPMRLTGVSSWFISPGEGERLRIRSRLLQRGRNVCVVRTEVSNADGRRVLEVVSSHAARAHAAH